MKSLQRGERSIKEQVSERQMAIDIAFKWEVVREKPEESPTDKKC